jgi:uncharacterized protein YkwD
MPTPSFGALFAAAVALSCADGARAADADFARRAAPLYAEPPNITACEAGQLTQAERVGVLGRVNAIRALHGLPAVAYAPDLEGEAMQAALIMAANGQLSHHPDATWKCYSAAGAKGAGESNLSGGVISRYLAFQTNPQEIDGWLSDIDNALKANIGHRRWLLDPFLKSIAFGRVVAVLPNGDAVDGAALVIIPGSNGSTTARGIVAYPIGDYPSSLCPPGALFSFGIIVDPSDKFANQNVDYAGATVSITAEDGAAVAVDQVAFDTAGYGLPNSLQFHAAPIGVNRTYHVRINHVVASGTPRDYTYDFKLTAP